MGQLIAARTAQMIDACTVSRPAAEDQTPVLDDDGDVVPATDTAGYAGPCTLSRFRSTGVRATVQATTTDQSGVPEPRTLKVPHGADVRPGDLVTITASAVAPELVGQRFRVLHEDPRTYATYRAFTVRGSSWQP